MWTTEGHAGRYIAGASPETVDVWVVPDTGHTGALDTHPDEWEQRVTTFLDDALDANRLTLHSHLIVTRDESAATLSLRTGLIASRLVSDEAPIVSSPGLLDVASHGCEANPSILVRAPLVSRRHRLGTMVPNWRGATARSSEPKRPEDDSASAER